jgi:hypothetical protein
MKRTAFHILSVTALTVALTATSEARQSEVAPQPRPRGGVQQAQKDAAKAAKQAQQLPRNLAPDQPVKPANSANRSKEQLQKNRFANAVVDRYLGGFQKNVGLDDEQTQRLSRRLGNYVRRQLNLADQKSQAFNRLKELNDQKGSEEEIQAQNRILEETEAQQNRARRQFFAEMNPELSVQQQAKLRVYMENTEQSIRQGIQKSRND